MPGSASHAEPRQLAPNWCIHSAKAPSAFDGGNLRLAPAGCGRSAAGVGTAIARQRLLVLNDAKVLHAKHTSRRALGDLGCGARQSAPASAASAAASASEKAERATPNAEPRLPIEAWTPAEPTWPDKEYGDSALLQAVAHICSQVAAGTCIFDGKDRQILQEALASALELTSPLQRDQALAAQQTCEHYPSGLVAALRADLWSECTEPIAAAALAREIPKERRALPEALRFAARVERIHPRFRTAPATITASKLDAYPSQLESWLNQSSQWLSAQESAVNGFTPGTYARALASWALARAWLELLSSPRIRLPPKVLSRPVLEADSMRQQLRGATAALSAEPTQRARRAVFDALRELGVSGVVRSERIDAWLDDALIQALPIRSPYLGLLLPPLRFAEAPTVRERYFAALPSYYAAWLLDAEPLEQLTAGEVEALLLRGLAPELRSRLSSRLPAEPQDAQTAQPLPTNLRTVLAWALGRSYVRSGLLSHEGRSFDYAASWFGQLPSGDLPEGGRDERAWLVALTAALRPGPQNAPAWETEDVTFDWEMLLSDDVQQTLPPQWAALGRANAAQLAHVSKGKKPRAAVGKLLSSGSTAELTAMQRLCIAAVYESWRDQWPPPGGERCTDFVRKYETLPRCDDCRPWAWRWTEPR